MHVFQLPTDSSQEDSTLSVIRVPPPVGFPRSGIRVSHDGTAKQQQQQQQQQLQRNHYYKRPEIARIRELLEDEAKSRLQLTKQFAPKIYQAVKGEEKVEITKKSDF